MVPCEDFRVGVGFFRTCVPAPSLRTLKSNGFSGKNSFCLYVIPFKCLPKPVSISSCSSNDMELSSHRLEVCLLTASDRSAVFSRTILYPRKSLRLPVFSSCPSRLLERLRRKSAPKPPANSQREVEIRYSIRNVHSDPMTFFTVAEEVDVKIHHSHLLDTRVGECYV